MEHLVYSLGVMLAQWLAKPFTHVVQGSNLTLSNDYSTSNHSSVGDDLLTNRTSMISDYPKYIEEIPVEVTDIEPVFLISGGISVTFGVACLLFVTTKCTWKQVLLQRKKEKEKEEVPRSELMVLKIVLMLIMFNLQVAQEVAYYSLIVTFVLKQMLWTKTSSMLIISMISLTAACARIFVAAISHCVGPKVIILLNLVITTISTIVLSAFVMSSDIIIWVCSITISMTTVTTSPAIMAWISEEIPQTGKVNFKAFTLN